MSEDRTAQARQMVKRYSVIEHHLADGRFYATAEERPDGNLVGIDDYLALSAASAAKDEEIARLRKALRWWAKYPEFKPNPERLDEVMADLKAALSESR